MQFQIDFQRCDLSYMKLKFLQYVLNYLIYKTRKFQLVLRRKRNNASRIDCDTLSVYFQKQNFTV